MFMKNFAMAGGFILLAIHGAGAYSLDNRLRANVKTNIVVCTTS